MRPVVLVALFVATFALAFIAVLALIFWATTIVHMPLPLPPVMPFHCPACA